MREVNQPQKGDIQVITVMLQSICNDYGQLEPCLTFATDLTAESDFNDIFEPKVASIDGLCFERNCHSIMKVVIKPDRARFGREVFRRRRIQSQQVFHGTIFINLIC